MVLYFHAVIFTGWVVFFIMQSALIRTRNVKLHRQLGWFGLALGIAIPILGIATAIAMGQVANERGQYRCRAISGCPVLRHGGIRPSVRIGVLLAEEAGTPPAPDFDRYMLANGCGVWAISEQLSAAQLVLRGR